MRKTVKTFTMATAVVLLAAPVHAGLDCARVKEMKQQGASAVDIARTLGLTTPDVQSCLAGVVEEPVMANPATKLPLSPQRPIGDGPIRRGPDGQTE